MKATSFCGLFVDGDRERLPYEADAWINQLGWYATNTDVTVPRVMVAFTCCDWLFAVTPDVLSVRVRWGTVSPVPVVDVIDAVLVPPTL